MQRYRVSAGKLAPGATDLLASLAVRGGDIPIAFAANMVVARLLGPADYGAYMTLLSAALVASAVAGWGFGTVMMREISGVSAASWPSVLASEGAWVVRKVTFLCILCTGLLVIWMWLGLGLPLSTWPQRLLALLLVPLSACLILFASILSGMHEVMRSQLVSTILRNASLLAGILLLGGLGVADVSYVLLAQVMSYAIAAWTAAIWINLKCPQAIKNVAPFLDQDLILERKRALQRSANHFFAVTLAYLVLGRVDVIIVNALSGTVEAGYFGAAARLAQFGAMAGLVWVAWIQPRVARNLQDASPSRLHRLLALSLAGSVLMTVSLVTIAWSLAPQIIALMGPEFHPSVWPFRWLLLGYLPWAASVPFFAYLAMSGRERYLSRALWAQALITIGSAFPLVHSFGALGASWAWAGGLAASSCAIIVLAIIALLRNHND